MQLAVVLVAPKTCKSIAITDSFVSVITFGFGISLLLLVMSSKYFLNLIFRRSEVPLPQRIFLSHKSWQVSFPVVWLEGVNLAGL